jgi:glycosyltransferase involved in cell wall biosynthesis
MKIALLSDYSIEEYTKYGKEKYWSTPKGIYDALISDHRISEVGWYPTPHNNKAFGFNELNTYYKSGKFIPDIIFYMSCGPSEGDKYFNKKNYPKSKLVVECGDEPQTFYYNQERTKNADLILTPDFECHLIYKSMGYSSIFTSHWTDINIFYPSLTNYQPFDVVTSMYGNRGDVVTFLQDSLKDSFYLKTGLKDIENGDLYRNGKIIFQKARYGEITRRIFEGMSCKKMVITDRLPSDKRLDTIFIEDKEIILYSSKEEALEKIKYYLNNTEEREKIAESGYNKVVKYYSTKNIVDYIING